MKIEDINNWKDIRKFLDERFGPHDDENCIGFIHTHSCKNCEEYFYLIKYQQKIAGTKYGNEKSLITRLDNSFKDTIEHMKLKYAN